MNGDFLKTSIPVNGRGDTINVQTVTEGDIIIPDSKPDISDVLCTDAYAIIKDEKTTDGRVSYSGELKLTVLYRGKNGELPICSVKTSLPFKDFINAEGVKKGDKVNLRYNLVNTKTSVVNDRKLNVKAMGEIAGVFDNISSMDVISSANEGLEVQVLEKEILYYMPKAHIVQDFSVEESFNIPSTKTGAMEVCRSFGAITDKELRATNGRVTVRGSLLIKVLYLGEDGAFIEGVEFKAPFGGSVDVADANDDSLVYGDIYIKSLDTVIGDEDNGEGRLLDVNAQIVADLYVSENKKTNIVSDIYSLKGYTDTKTINLTYPKMGIHSVASTNIRETVSIDPEAPEILQIKDVTAYPEIDSVTASEDIVNIGGTINANVLYVTRDDNEPIASTQLIIPFETDVELKGINEDSDISTTVNISEITYSPITDRDLEIRFTLDEDVFAIINDKRDFLLDATVSDRDMPREKAAIVIYTVKKGDTLWNIAKTYNTTIRDITDINNIENPDIIYPGQRLIILKRGI